MKEKSDKKDGKDGKYLHNCCWNGKCICTELECPFDNEKDEEPVHAELVHKYNLENLESRGCYTGKKDSYYCKHYTVNEKTCNPLNTDFDTHVSLYNNHHYLCQDECKKHYKTEWNELDCVYNTILSHDKFNQKRQEFEKITKNGDKSTDSIQKRMDFHFIHDVYSDYDKYLKHYRGCYDMDNHESACKKIKNITENSKFAGNKDEIDYLKSYHSKNCTDSSKKADSSNKADSSKKPESSGNFLAI